MKLKLYNINEDYYSYLKEIDNKVSYSAEDKNTRPYAGVVLSINGYEYYAPLSSPKTKHLTMKNNIDFLKIDKGTFGVINLNNMIPITKDLVVEINPKEIKKPKYHNLIINQLDWCNKLENKDKILVKAKKLYEKIISGNYNQNIKDRTCNFPKLENALNNYINNDQNIENKFSLDGLAKKQGEVEKQKSVTSFDNIKNNKNDLEK